MKLNRCPLDLAASVMLFLLAGVASAQDANRTYTHPAEANQTKDLTLGPGNYVFRTDPDPNTYLYVEWFNTYSGTGGLIDSAYLLYYDDTTVNIVSNGWVRAEVYRSDFWNNKYEWLAAYRWNITVTNTVTATAGTGGTVSPSSRSVSYGSTTTFTVYPSTGYTRGSVSGDASGGSWNGNTYTTASVTQNRNLTFSFVAQSYSITDAAFENKQDLDGDGYASEFDIKWKSKVNFGSATVTAEVWADSWEAGIFRVLQCIFPGFVFGPLFGKRFIGASAASTFI